MTDPILVTMTEAARLLSIDRRTLDRWRVEGIIATRKIRGRRFVPMREIRKFELGIAGQDATPTASPVAGGVTGQTEEPTLEIVINQAVA